MCAKVYVMLGFHTSFYHSWRGDTPDRASVGTDIRMVREMLKGVSAFALLRLAYYSLLHGWKTRRT